MSNDQSWNPSTIRTQPVLNSFREAFSSLKLGNDVSWGFTEALVPTDKSGKWKWPRKLAGSQENLQGLWYMVYEVMGTRLNFLPLFPQRTRIKVLKKPDTPPGCALSNVTSKLNGKLPGLLALAQNGEPTWTSRVHGPAFSFWKEGNWGSEKAKVYPYSCNCHFLKPLP